MEDLSTRAVLFTMYGSLAKRAVWKRTAPNIRKSTMYLVQTKANELANFPGVNTPSYLLLSASVESVISRKVAYQLKSFPLVWITALFKWTQGSPHSLEGSLGLFLLKCRGPRGVGSAPRAPVLSVWLTGRSSTPICPKSLQLSWVLSAVKCWSVLSGQQNRFLQALWPDSVARLLYCNPVL